MYRYTINGRGVKFRRLCVYLLKFYFLKATVQVYILVCSGRLTPEVRVQVLRNIDIYIGALSKVIKYVIRTKLSQYI
jgi:hypothetical protein